MEQLELRLTPTDIWLDFAGSYVETWGAYHPGVVEAYPIPVGLEDALRDDWSAFNVDIVFTKPDHNDYVRVRVDGHNDWVSGAGGIAYHGTYFDRDVNLNGLDHTVFIFPEVYQLPDRFAVASFASAISHEVGHAFSLGHQSEFRDGKFEEYAIGNESFAPIMGLPYYAERTIWWDESEVTRLSNAIGLKPDVEIDQLPFTGIIGPNDRDSFSFYTDGYIDVGVTLPKWPNLNPELVLTDAGGAVVASAKGAPITEANRIRGVFPAGEYTLTVKGVERFNMGQYTLSGITSAFPGSRSASEFLQDGDMVIAAAETHVKYFGLSGEVASFFAFDPAFKGGITLAGSSERLSVVANGIPHVKVYDHAREVASFFAYDPAYSGNVKVRWVGGAPHHRSLLIREVACQRV